MQKSREYYKCLNCGKEASYPLSQKKYYPTVGKYCSRICRYEYYRKHPESTPAYKNGKTHDSAGYIQMMVEDVNGDRVKMREHRFLMEKKIGRKLLQNEHIHHINGIKDDNRLDNLILLSKSKHHKIECEKNPQLYSKALKKGREKRWGDYKKNNKWSVEFDKCIRCGTRRNKHQAKGLCTKCYLKEYRERNIK